MTRATIARSAGLLSLLSVVALCGCAGYWLVGTECVDCVDLILKRRTRPSGDFSSQAQNEFRAVFLWHDSAGNSEAAVLSPEERRQNNISETATIRVLSEWADDFVKELGEGPEVAVPALIEVMHRDESQIVVRVFAIKVLGWYGPDAQEALPDLINALDHEEWTTRATAAAALGWMGPVARDAIPALTTLLQDEDEFVRENAGRALAQIQGGG
ncbi:HEAT repeat domain-containing protein [Gemmatimonadota bacterium]